MEKRTAWTSAAARRLMTMAGDPPSIGEAVRIIADRILDGVSNPPVDLEAVASKLNIVAICPEDIPMSGELRRNGNDLKIVYSSYQSAVRRRFTIAHEMGHAIFERSGRGAPRVGAELERLCDMLATEILMPRDVFLKLAKGELIIERVFELARAFNTSLSATAIRCAELRRVSAFEVDDMRVIWGYGIIRRGSLRRMNEALRLAVEKAMTENAGGEVVYLNDSVWRGDWRLEWARLGQQKRALFLLQPIKINMVAGSRSGR